jgi:hypothetical protein
MLRVTRHDDADAFLERAEAWLLQREAENNVLLSVAYLLAQGAKPFRQPAYLATIETGGEVAGCAMRAPPDGAYLTAVPAAAVPTVAAQLREVFTDVPEVIGPEAVAVAFAQCWSGRDWEMHSRLQRYVLEAAVPPKKAVAGVLRLGNAGDRALIDAWAAEYRREIRSKVDIVAFFRRMIEREGLYLWDDSGPRCVVTASGRTPNGARISAAYTPPSFRGNGYATNAVASLSRVILDGGKRFCVISADVDDPAPNAIYRGLGYRPMGRLALIHLAACRT